MAITINQLAFVDQIAANDQFPIYQTSNGTGRRVSMNAILEFIEANLTSGTTPSGEVVIIASPVATGFTEILPDNNASTWLILAPTGAFATGAITLPSVANLTNGQHITLNTTQAVTAFAINPSGASLGVVPNTLGAGGFFKIQYSTALNTWFRVA